MASRTAGRAGGVFDDAAHRQQLHERLRQAPPQGARWTLRRVQGGLAWLQSYSPSGLSRLLGAFGCRVRSARVQQFSPDPDYADKVEHLLECLRQVAQAPHERVLLFLDEMGYTAWPTPAPQWAPEAPTLAPLATKRPPQGTSATNNRQWRVVGALNAWDGQVEFLDDYKVGRKQLIRFYGQLARRYSPAQRVFVVQDNRSVHRHEEVQEALKEWPQIEVVWLPTYAPWLNPIEKLWRWLRQDVLHMHRLAGDFPALRQQVREFLSRFASGSCELLHYVGLKGQGLLASALRHHST